MRWAVLQGQSKACHLGSVSDPTSIAPSFGISVGISSAASTTPTIFQVGRRVHFQSEKMFTLATPSRGKARTLQYLSFRMLGGNSDLRAELQDLWKFLFHGNEARPRSGEALARIRLTSPAAHLSPSRRPWL